MEVKISDMMDCIQDDTVHIKAENIVTSEKVKQRTMNKLHTDNSASTRRRTKTGVILIAAIVTSALLVGSAFAAWQLLTPKDVALRDEDQALAAAFDSADAVSINQSIQTGDLTVTLLGIVSGKDISDCWVKRDGEFVDDRSYIVVSVSYTDGHPVTMEQDDEVYGNVRIAAVFEGYAPWVLNSMMFSGGNTWFIEDGVLYQLASCDNLQIFADKTVYLGVYTDGIAPGAEMFAIDENGRISIKEDYDEPCALFELPLDASKADPDAVIELIDSFNR